MLLEAVHNWNETHREQISHMGDNGVERQLFHSVDLSWNEEGVIFAWHAIFDDQEQTVMTGLYPYLRTYYGDTVDQYFTPELTTLQANQTWDSEKRGYCWGRQRCYGGHQR